MARGINIAMAGGHRRCVVVRFEQNIVGADRSDSCRGRDRGEGVTRGIRRDVTDTSHVRRPMAPADGRRCNWRRSQRDGVFRAGTRIVNKGSGP
jgi:hypothetical protein